MNDMKSIISVPELETILGNENLRLIDASSGPDAQTGYLDKHLDKARFVDLELDLSDRKDPKDGGRHPLPSPAAFSETLANLGIDAGTHVVVYDRASGANAAARFWWMAQAAGIKNVQVLDGGFDAAVSHGIPTVNGAEPAPEKSAFHFDAWQFPTVTIDVVQALTNDPSALIIDVREAARYKGETEPIDLIAGHIPSAINIPLRNNLEPDGKFKTADTLRDYYASYFQGKDAKKIVIHCGSGVTACHTLLALDYAGFDIATLYVGSWSEWSRNQLPMEPTRA